MDSIRETIEGDTRSTRNRRGAALVATIEAVSPAMLLLWLYLVALAVNLSFGAIVHFRPQVTMLEADEREYYDLATRLLDGSWQLTPRRTLGFPLMLAALRAMGANFLVLQVAITAFYSLSAPLLFQVVRRLGGAKSGAVLAALALILWPTTAFFGSSLYSETAALPVFLLALALLPPGSRTRAVGPKAWVAAAVAAGAALGLAAHLRPMYLLYLPFLLLTIVCEERRWRIAAARFGCALAGFALVIAPWSISMSARFHQPIILTSNGGETLAGGLTPQLLRPGGHTGIYVTGRRAWVGPGKWVPIEDTGYLTAAERQLPYAQTDGLLRTRATAWALAHPFDAAWLELCKLAYMWGFYGLGSNPSDQIAFGNVPIIALLVLTLTLLVLRRTDRAALSRLWLLAGFVSLVALISWGSWRFRQPGDAGLLAFCAVSLFELVRARARAWPDRPR